MFSRAVRMATVCCLFLSVFMVTTYGVHARAQQPPTIEQLTAACQAAKEAFTPRTEAHLRQAKEALQAAVEELDRKLKVSGANAPGWRSFLEWDRMQEELAREEGPNLEVLDAVHAKYASGHNGLDLVAFANVRRALRRYLTTARAIGNEKLRAQYQALLDALSGHLEAYHNEPTTERATLIGQSVLWLEEAGQAAELIDAIRGHFAQPNLFIQISADYITAGIAQPVDDTQPIEDVVRGTRISGTQHTTGTVTAELIPREAFAEIDALFRGTTVAQTVGRNGPARVTSESITKVATRKAIRIRAEKIWTLAAESNAVTTTRFKSIRAQGGPMVQRQVRQRVYAQKRQAEQDTSEEAKRRANQRMDEQTDEQMGRLAEDYQANFREPLLKRGLFPQLLRFYTTEEALHAVALHGGLPGLGAAGPPPALQGDHHMAVRLHESLVNNFMEAAWGGMIIEEETLRTQVTDLVGSTPTWLEPDEQSQPITITFARRQPFTVTFAEGGFIITLRGRKYERAGSSYPGMNVTAIYRIEHTDEGLKAIRQGDLRIFPPGFTPGAGKQLSTRQQLLRSLLEKRFGKIFQEQIVPEPLTPPEAWENAGELVLSDWTASNGWMVLNWKRVPPAEKAEEEAPAGQQAAENAPSAPQTP